MRSDEIGPKGQRALVRACCLGKLPLHLQRHAQVVICFAIGHVALQSAYEGVGRRSTIATGEMGASQRAQQARVR